MPVNNPDQNTPDQNDRDQNNPGKHEAGRPGDPTAPDPAASTDRASANSSTTATALPPKPKPSRNRLIALATVAVLVVAGVVTTLALTLGRGDSSAAGRSTVKIGTTEASSPYWPVLQKLAADKGIDIELVNFSDYTQANPALRQGQIDLNLFQHLLYLANYNVENNDTLTPIGSTLVVPLSLYSRKHTALQQIPAGGTIAIPQDATNQARALLVLQQAGLLKLKGGGSVLSTPADIDTAASKVTVTPVDAAQTVAALPGVDGAIVNNNFASVAKLDPKSALFSDDPAKPAAEPYINAFVARAADKDNPTYRTVAELYYSPEVQQAVTTESKGTAVLVKRPAADLQKIEADLEKQVQSA